MSNNDKLSRATFAPQRSVVIEHVQLGSPVPTKNPKHWKYDAWLPEQDTSTWCKVSLTVPRGDGGAVDMELLRPRW